MAILNLGVRWPMLWRWVLLLLLGVVVACAALVPQHGWDANFGPVVPHDSFPADCSLCHQAGGWHQLRADFTYDHQKATGVELRGAHANAGCLLCHNDRGPVQQFAAQGCAGCHADPHLDRLGRNCGDCHQERTWTPNDAIARHDRTRFPLVGPHAAAACFRCHPGAQVGNFAGAPVECSQCHRDDRDRTVDPNHVQLGYVDRCERCHVPVDWRPARFDHPASFPLTQGHAGRSCRSCHQTPNVFTGLSTDCASCHADRYTNALEPAHGSAGFGTACAQCHGSRGWAPASWPHPTTFPLTFAHAGRRCTACHAGQVYQGTSGTCSSCHLAAFQNTRNPNHVQLGYPTDCAACHRTASWRGGTSEHPATFPLQNAHQRACSTCHTTPGTYSGLSPQCAACHQAEYQATSNPPHAAYQMSTQCQQCHGTAAWRPATFVHRFPITSGEHRNLACFDCHDNAANRAQFECIHCHEHRQTKMNDEHRGVSGYVWASANCYQCHPRGRH
ncbi:MAG: hypothetical protein JNK49_09030 [Planctomycetes bacterium]|nr:hypothetical protein [Planctomycetota bacterium]